MADEPAVKHRPLRGWVKHRLIRDLAEEKFSQYELADKYGVTQPSIAAFKRRFSEEIAEVAANAENEMAGLWIAKKRNRLAEYERQAEMIDEALETLGKTDSALLRLKQMALRNSAEEMGHLKQNVEVDHKVTHYTVEGIDPKDLT